MKSYYKWFLPVYKNCQKTRLYVGVHLRAGGFGAAKFQIFQCSEPPGDLVQALSCMAPRIPGFNKQPSVKLIHEEGRNVAAPITSSQRHNGVV